MPALNEIATLYSNLPVSPDLYYYFTTKAAKKRKVFSEHFLGVLGGKRTVGRKRKINC